MKTQITLQDLAPAIGGKYWEKGDRKRVYLDKGWNTKKMRTSTYVYQKENGTFGVSCFIECPGQPWAWIQSQKERVITQVEELIESATATA